MTATLSALLHSSHQRELGEVFRVANLLLVVSFRELLESIG